TLMLGVLVAVPTVVVAGPLFGKLAGRWVDVPAPEIFEGREERDVDDRPAFGATVATVLLPVILMMAKAVVDITVDDPEQRLQQVFDVVGNPFVALLIAVVVAMFTLGRASGMDRAGITRTVESSLPAIAGILLIVSAGGGFKQVLVDTGIGTLLADWAKGANISVLVLAWVLAVLIRLATGSATVATITASALMLGLVEGLSTGETSLVVLAIGSGSVFFSHVNDAGFWLVKEYFGLSVGQTLKSWSLMETVLSVSGLVFVLLLGLVV
ncbi:MAG: idnT, partial [Marmoricola sp.]|nr:idnT [Marmoricola sp.]